MEIEMSSPYYRQSGLVLFAQRTLTGILAAAFLISAIGAAVYGLFFIVGIAKEILVAVIAGSATLLSAVFAYVFQRNRELELAAIQRDREIELVTYRNRKELEMDHRKQLQENYGRILSHLAPFVRNPKQTGDDFTTAHLHTWVTGSPEVVLVRHNS